MNTKIWRYEFMKKYVCEPCGYVYDPEAGDPDGGIAQELLLKTSRTTGYALSAGWEKKYSWKSNLKITQENSKNKRAQDPYSAPLYFPVFIQQPIIKSLSKLNPFSKSIFQICRHIFQFADDLHLLLPVCSCHILINKTVLNVFCFLN